MSKIVQINSHVDRRIKPIFFQVEVIEIDDISREIIPIDFINSLDLTEEEQNVDAADSLVKTAAVINYLIEHYNSFDKNEKIHLFGYDLLIKNLIKRINQITLKLQFPIMKSHFKNNSIESFVDLLADRYRFN